jgi:hypothetical protein
MASTSADSERGMGAGVAVVCLATLLVACGQIPDPGNLAGREICWPDGAGLQAMTLEGVLRIDTSGALLGLPDGRLIEVGFAKYGMIASRGPARVESDDGRVVAIAGERVRLFGGMTTDGRLFRACEIDARQAPEP